jgi:hypothetical protein
MSRNKGNKNENKLAKILDEWFYKEELENWDQVFPHLCETPEKKRRIIRRTPMSGGWSKCGDLKVDPEFKNIPEFPFFVEAKDEKKLDETQIFRGVGSLYGYLAQAQSENNGKNPLTVVIFTTERRPYYMVVSEEDFKVIDDNCKLDYVIHDRKNKVVQFYLEEFLETSNKEFFRNLKEK